tara:strand:- start:157 stop:1803 length:1647 start_codon:yes stop_codon:yes gene_type:complete
MDRSTNKQHGYEKISKITTFSIPNYKEEECDNIIINSLTTLSKEKIITLALKFHSLGNISEASKHYQSFINHGYIDKIVFSNYGIILRKQGNLKEAEVLTRKAIELNPDYSVAHSNLGLILRDLGKLKEAELSTRKAIELKPNFADAYSNLGIILKDLGNLKEAEISTRKAIELNPNLAIAYSTLGGIFIDLGEFKEAEVSLRQAIDINPDLTNIFYAISKFKKFDISKRWKDNIFASNILNNKSIKDQINIYFARANILHKETNYNDSSKYLLLANKLKLDLYSSNSNFLINKSQSLLIESEKQNCLKSEQINFPQSIFVVGMPRSGSTLIESILSINNNIKDLGETNIFEESFIEQKDIMCKISLAELYLKKTSLYENNFNITTNKYLYNYQYAGIIANQIPNVKIIHCFRNPLDNILSIYRTHFAKGNEYSSSLIDCANVYLDHDRIMTKYKNKFRSNIYDLNYDLLVTNPKKEIKSLITWLGWEWDNTYLSPHLNKRSVSTASNVQVRSPINTNSIDGWKNYIDMLSPVIKIITREKKFKDINY